jgi:hypothetical protein
MISTMLSSPSPKHSIHSSHYFEWADAVETLVLDATRRLGQEHAEVIIADI